MKTLSLALVLALVGCHKQPVETNVTSSGPAPRASSAPAPDTVKQEIRRNFERVHFAYDSANLDAESKASLARNADLLRAYPDLRVEVQGHCDERGTTDYNIALGERRARTVVSYLVTTGAAPSRVSALSYGEERPLVAGGGESIWSQNRRAEFRLLSDNDVVAGTTN